MEIVKYMNGSVIDGVDYDWKKYLKIYKNIVIDTVPDEDTRKLFDWQIDFPITRWLIELSERSIGKTTKWLLFGTICHWYAGLRIEYLRINSDMIRPSVCGEMWDTIIEYGYIEKVTGGEYNTVIYRNKGYYLAFKNEKGEIEKEEDDELCHLHALSNVDLEKSTYNSPRGDIIIFDEFIPVNGVTSENLFIELCQMVSTIGRLRKNFKIVLLSNTVNPYTHIFHELDISHDIQHLKRGEHKILTTPSNMKVSVNWLSLDTTYTTKKRDRLMEVFGFSNPRLSSIYGGDTWEVKNYQHLPKLEHNVTMDTHRVYIEYYNSVLQVKLCSSDVLGTYLLIHSVDYVDEKKARLIFTTNQAKDTRYIFGLSHKYGKFIYDMWVKNKIYFAHNDDGQIFENFISFVKNSGK